MVIANSEGGLYGAMGTANDLGDMKEDKEDLECARNLGKRMAELLERAEQAWPASSRTGRGGSQGPDVAYTQHEIMCRPCGICFRVRPDVLRDQPGDRCGDGD